MCEGGDEREHHKANPPQIHLDLVPTHLFVNRRRNRAAEHMWLVPVGDDLDEAQECQGARQRQHGERAGFQSVLEQVGRGGCQCGKEQPGLWGTDSAADFIDHRNGQREEQDGWQPHPELAVVRSQPADGEVVERRVFPLTGDLCQVAQRHQGPSPCVGFIDPKRLVCELRNCRNAGCQHQQGDQERRIPKPMRCGYPVHPSFPFLWA